MNRIGRPRIPEDDPRLRAGASIGTIGRSITKYTTAWPDEFCRSKGSGHSPNTDFLHFSTRDSRKAFDKEAVKVNKDVGPCNIAGRAELLNGKINRLTVPDEDDKLKILTRRK